MGSWVSRVLASHHITGLPVGPRRRAICQALPAPPGQCRRPRLRAGWARPDEECRPELKAFAGFARDEQEAAKALPDALILKHQARRWASAS